MCLRKKYFFLLIFIALSSAAFGQAANTPFSTFGIGEPYGNALIPSQGMAGVGVSQPQFYSINNQNPALLVFNYYSSFQAGAILESRTIKADTMSQKGVNGNLNYLVAAFPVKVGKWTTSFGLMPYTNVNYKLSYQEQVVGSPDDTTAVIERGDGGLTQFYWSNGVRIHDDFSIGIKATYLFGSVNRDYSNLIDTDYSAPDAPTLFIVGIKEQTYVKDFMFSGGLSYSKDSLFNSNYRFSAGLVYSFATKLKTTKTTVLQRRVSDGTPITSDTLLSDPGNISIPSALTFGVSLSKGSRWNAGIEFSTQDWSQYKNLENSNENLENMWKVAIGGEYTPDALATNYLKRITYRAGMSYEKNPFVIENPAGSGTYRSIKDVGINFGFSLPTGLSSLDCGFRIGKRGDQVETVFEETYYKIYFGISFNDKWFIKRRFD
jgi:long-subunit fatty acid transport protein